MRTNDHPTQALPLVALQILCDGFQRPLAGEDGIVTVGVVPFLLDPGILLGA